MMNLGFDVIIFKSLYMPVTPQSPTEGTTTANILLFLITLLPKSHEIFKLMSLCHIAIRVKANKTQTDLMHCYNSHVWVDCRQPPHYIGCVGRHLHNKFPENGNTALIPTCCNYKLVDIQQLHPTTNDATGTPRKRCEREISTAPKTRMGRVLHITPALSFIAVLCYNAGKAEA
jgi:hypothetical protein